MDIRLRALVDAPHAFGARVEDVRDHPDGVWEQRAAEGAFGCEQATFVAEAAGTLVGIAVGVATGDQTSVYSVWTDPGWRGRGVGSTIMERLAGWARTCGSRGLRLWVAEANPGAERWYRNMGFVPTGATRLMRSNPDEREREFVRTLGQPSRSSTV